MIAVRWAQHALCLLAALAAAASFLPLVPVDLWEVRVLDFPRLQFAIVTVALLIGLVALPATVASRAAAVACVFALAWHALHLVPYSPLVTPTVRATSTCGSERSLRLLVANVQMANRDSDRFLAMVRAAEADVALFLETDDWWDSTIGRLRDAYPFALQQIQSNFYGMHLVSRRPLASGDIRPGAGALPPSLRADLRLGSGDLVRLYGVHPRPPRPGQDTKGRDAEILGAAERAGDDGMPSIMAGDLNAVPWGGVVRTALRVGGLADPRVGRGFMATWLAESSLVRWPLDHILADERFELIGSEVLPAFGSDHLPLVAGLCLQQ